GGIDQAVGGDGIGQAGVGGPAGVDGVDEGPVGLDVGGDGEAHLVLTQRQVGHPRRRRAVPDLGAFVRLDVQGAAEVVVEPRQAVPAEDLQAAGRAPAEDVVPHADQVGGGARGEAHGHGGHVLHALVAREVGGAAADVDDLAQAEPEDV